MSGEIAKQTENYNRDRKYGKVLNRSHWTTI
jgi:hypothetical protein